MNHSLKRVSNGRYTLALAEAPENLRPFEMAPPTLEPELMVEPWLLLLVAVWSAPDLQAIETLESLARRYPNANFGVRPFEDHREHSVWCPRVKEQLASPLWLFLRNGELVEELSGLRGEGELDEVLRCILPE